MFQLLLIMRGAKKNVGSNQQTPDFQRIVIFNEFDLAALMNAG